MKSRRLRWACSTNGDKMNTYRILVGNQEEKYYQEDQNVGGWIILKSILERERMGLYGLV
jgi:hypothetical protein